MFKATFFPNLFVMKTIFQKLFFFLLVITFLGSCNKDDDDAELRLTDEAFTEGILYTEVTMPGNRLSELLNKIDPAKGNIEQQLADEISKLPIEEQEALTKSIEESGMFALVALMTPFHTQLNVRPDEILAQGTALNYYLENYQSTTEDKGFFYLSSYSSENDMLGTYTPSKSESIWQSVTITHEDYNIERLPEEALVAGYSCKKAYYTLKNPTDMEFSGNPLSLMVYTSENMPKELNFQHPFYIPEDNGILRIDITYDTAGKNKMVYEIVDVVPQEMRDEDFEVEQSTNIYDLDVDDPEAGAAMLTIMFGTE